MKPLEYLVSLGQIVLLRLWKPKHKSIVIYLVPSKDIISGGILSVIAMYKTMKKQESLCNVHTFLCNHPQAKRLTSYSMHNTELKIQSFYRVLRAIPNESKVIFHVPATHLTKFIMGLNSFKFVNLIRDKSLKLSLNLLNQNPFYFPDLEPLSENLALFKEITQTTAHKAYDTDVNLGDFNIRSFYLGTQYGIDTHPFVPRQQRKKIMLVSHDEHKDKAQVLQKIQSLSIGLEIIVVNDMPYDRYVYLQNLALFSISFGEGLDFYFIRQFLSGGVGFSVFNKTFFTPDFENLSVVFKSWEDLSNNIALKIEQLYYNAVSYKNTVAKTRQILAKYYNHQDYKKKLEILHKNWSRLGVLEIKSQDYSCLENKN